MSIGVPASFSELPANSTLLELMDDVLRFLNLPSDSNSRFVAKRGLKHAVDHFNLRQWKMLLTTQPITTVTSQIDYSLPRDVRGPRHLHLLDTSGNYKASLPFKDAKSFDLEHPDASLSGSPGWYTIYSYHSDGLLSLDKSPDAAFVALYPTMHFRYFRKLMLPTETGGALNAPAEVEHLLVWYANWTLAGTYAPEKADIASRSWREIWQLLTVLENEERDWSET